MNSFTSKYPKKIVFTGLALVSLSHCTVKSPDIIVQGSSPQDALLFLENYQKGERDKKQLGHYTKHLRENHAPGFDWPIYWSEITKRKLYQNLDRQELDQALSLVETDCSEKNLAAYAELLLQIARSDGEKLLFSQEISRLRQSCGALPQNSFKSIVGFLSQKRGELEKAKIGAEKKLAQSSKIPAQAAAEKKPDFIYTSELQKVLVGEWAAGANIRSWGDILETVDRDFWGEARLLNHQSGDRRHLADTLKMERAALGSVAAKSLNPDIFLMLKTDKKMSALVKGANYRDYFSRPRSVDWAALWRNMAAAYPENPKNGNADSLLSLYKFSSCHRDSLGSYIKLAEKWGFSSYAQAAKVFCAEKDRKEVQAAYKIEDFLGMAKNVALDVFEEIFQKYESANQSRLDLLDKALNGEGEIAGALEDSFAVTNLPYSKVIKNAFFVLWTYGEEKDKHPHKEYWKGLVERHFSQKDWLNLMSVFRSQYDRINIEKVLAMHHYIYGGKVPFLAADIQAVLADGYVSAAEMESRYGYEKAYLAAPDIQKLIQESFWAGLEKSLKKTPQKLLQTLPMFEAERSAASASGGASAGQLKEKWQKLLSDHVKESDWLALMGILRGRASPQGKEDIKRVLAMHHYIYGGKVPFLSADIQAILQSENLSGDEPEGFFANKLGGYGYEALYLEDPEIQKLIRGGFWAALKQSLPENPGNFFRAAQLYEKELERAGFAAFESAAGAAKIRICSEDTGEQRPDLQSCSKLYEGRKSQFKRDWEGLLKEHFAESDWLALMSAFRREGGITAKNHIERVLSMNHFIYGGKVPFLAADIQAILADESLTASELSKKHGYSEAYLAQRDIQDIFWKGLKQSLEENPQRLMRAVEAFEGEKTEANDPQKFKQRWSSLLARHFLESDWLELMLALRKSGDRGGIEKVLAMHHYIYGGKVPFLSADIQAILQSEEFSVADMEKYGYGPAYINDSAVLQDFWRGIETAAAAADKASKYKWQLNFPASLQEGAERCGYSYVGNLFEFFRAFGKEPLLFEQFRFASCPHFIEDFQQKELARLIQLAGQGAFRQDGDRNYSLRWWLAHILFLNSPSPEEAGAAAAKISASDWRRLIQDMLYSYSIGYSDYGPLFQKAFKAARMAHGLEAEAAVCSYFSFDEDPRKWIQNQSRVKKASGAIGESGKSIVYDPRWLMEIFHDLSWDSKTGRSRKKPAAQKFCSRILPLKKRNTLLYAISESLFYRVRGKAAARLGDPPFPEAIPEIWAAAEEIMDLSVKMNRFESSDIWGLAFKSLFEFVSKDMDRYSFYINFSHQILQNLMYASNGDKTLALSYLRDNVWSGKPPATAYHRVYRDWMEELLKKGSYPFPPGAEIFVPLPFEFASREAEKTAAKRTINSKGQAKKAVAGRNPDSAKQPKMDYGQVFMEDIQDSEEYRYEIAAFGGMDLLNPSAQSYFGGGEIKYKFSSLAAVGLEGVFYQSKPAASSKALGKAISGYGLRFGYDLPKYAVYLNGYYYVFKSHLNLAGFFKTRMDFPAHFGLGFTGLKGESGKTYLSMKFGAGPRIQINPWFSFQLLLSLSAAPVEKSVFLLYPWVSLGLALSF